MDDAFSNEIKPGDIMQITITQGWYNTKYALAEAIVPILIRYRENYPEKGYSLPTWITDNREGNYSDSELAQLTVRWIAEVDEMILGFKGLMGYQEADGTYVEYDEAQTERAIALLSKYFLDLWD